MVEEKLQFVLITRSPRMRGQRLRGAVEGTGRSKQGTPASCCHVPAAARMRANHARRERRRDGGSAGFTADAMYRGAM